MYKSMYVAASGAIAARSRLDVLTNNLANVNTPGFKADQLVFESILAQSEKNSAPEAGKDAPATSHMRQGEFVVATESYSDFSQGPVRTTGNPLDIALQGEGFLAVMTYEGERYTRMGNLQVGPNGELVTASGHIVLDEQDRAIFINDGVATIDENGYVWVERESGVVGNNDAGITSAATPRSAGRLKLVDFEKPYRLIKEGNGLYSSSDPGAIMPADLKVSQGRLESSNVNMVRQMTELIQNQRVAETYQKVIQESDNMTTQLILQVGRAV